jgi:hypothetical protein
MNLRGGYQPRNIFVKDENGDLLVDSHNILNRWKNYFSQLLHAHNVSDVWQIVVHTAEPLVPGLSHLEVEIVIAKLKKYKSPSRYQILTLTKSSRRLIVTVRDPQTLYFCLE